MPGKHSIALQLIGGGGGAHGGSGMDGGATREHTRFSLRNAWNGAAASGTVNGNKVGATPFRAVNNAGDLLNRTNYVSGGSNQVNTGRIRIAANQSANVLGGSIYANQILVVFLVLVQMLNLYMMVLITPSLKKQQAVNRNYNDSSYGGANNASQVPLAHVRH